MFNRECATSSNVVYYRYILRKGTSKVEVRHACDNYASAYIGGQSFSALSDYVTARSASVIVYGGMLLIAFRAEDTGGAGKKSF